MKKQAIDDFIWAQKYRPKTVKDCILPKGVKKILVGMSKESNIQNLTFYGDSGIGKTTAAIALCEDVRAEYIVLEGSSEDRGIDAIRTKIMQFAVTMGEGRPKVVIIDEADNLTYDAQMALRGVIEKVSKNCKFILTCNFRNKIQSAILSRCQPIGFSIPKEERKTLLIETIKKFSLIMKKEGVDVDKEYAKETVYPIVDKFFPDFRETLNNLQFLKFGAELEQILSGGNEKIDDLIVIMTSNSNHKWMEMRRWVSEEMGDPNLLIKWMFDNGEKIIQEKSLAQFGIYLDEYQDKLFRAANYEITISAMFTMITANCEFK
ncbi:MAG: AAA family ATPase [Ignavibacteriae bacterium]|nr:AAA family ATPase [Ignavibacteriota bacterium]